MSTFGGLNTAYSGLVAARAGLDVVGQNIANVNTEGYTRQRVTTSATNAAARAGLVAWGATPGTGVSVDGIARLGSATLDAKVRATAATAGYTAVRANALGSVENSLKEPGVNGLSHQLQEFWAAWQDLVNGADPAASAGLLLGEAGQLTSQITAGYRAVTDEWAVVRGSADALVTEVNGAAAQVGELNGIIRQTLASGGSANELIDKRDALTATISAITGASVRPQANGTVDVLIGGNPLVSGTDVQTLAVVGPTTMPTASDATNAVRVVWTHRPETVGIDGGELAGALSLLGPADSAGTGGALAQAAASYNGFAVHLADTVNGIHLDGVTSTGELGGKFFEYVNGNAAASLRVVPTNADEIAAGAVGAGAANGANADKIAQLGTTHAVDKDGLPVSSPNSVWSEFVTRLGVATGIELAQASSANLSATAAVTLQLSNSSVDIDEENVNLLTFQHAYQGAARVMTAVDEMLDTLINRTGLVGR
ncbi:MULTISPECIES: flagellar hook-associated protein FlgK [unclassified Cryobacterium]|uniref:flagellar hook-associated protein FlgK n=1 Tax=unclassified Cryobacterium TaxID=2649013 RepID=UPI00106BC02D|nr:MULTISPECIES: flagellar hook-associated protein FlgK [unclassified Cryobacterium]TFC53507.1 flagellar hook-associated protein FlgK [Cryobacterium sp. TMB3-1-2]TFC69173.1 flagellar hook-associated protein FlgK [Cryobacterium sp. TMB3-15]TFC76029.1 flagellar hook-associated protein FlgK [Cryobacterium sp. TMB3-10]TFD39900.1 flagellar hook-associated protein FlgK [Cryobacterium sp. TMB3-12]